MSKLKYFFNRPKNKKHKGYNHLYALFKNYSLLEQGLRHRSLGPPDNERLEWLGDSVLHQTISLYLYNRYPHIDEGLLSHIRNYLIKNETIRKLEPYLHLPLAAPEPLGSHLDIQHFYANTFEAVVGALYLDRGQVFCHKQILIWYKSLLKQLPAKPQIKDFKEKISLLKEYLDALAKTKNKHYRVCYEMEWDDAHRSWRTCCVVSGLAKPLELKLLLKTNSKTEAKNIAASKMLAQLQQTKTSSPQH